MTGDEQLKELVDIDVLTVFDLLIRCPRSQPPHAPCPLAHFRAQCPSDDKFHFAESLPKEQRQALLAYHNRCRASDFTRGIENNQFEYFTPKIINSAGNIRYKRED